MTNTTSGSWTSVTLTTSRGGSSKTSSFLASIPLLRGQSTSTKATTMSTTTTDEVSKMRELIKGDTFRVAEDNSMGKMEAGELVRVIFTEPKEYVGDVRYKVESIDIPSRCTEWCDITCDIDWSTINGDEPENAQYLVYCPDTDKVPTKWYFSHKQAKYVARDMVKTHGMAFYVLRATERYTVGAVVKEEL